MISAILYVVRTGCQWRMLPADFPNYGWPDTSDITGIVFQRSRMRIRDVTDGTSSTYMIGEKYLNPDYYDTGTDRGDNENLYTGFNSGQTFDRSDLW